MDLFDSCVSLVETLGLVGSNYCEGEERRILKIGVHLLRKLLYCLGQNPV